MCPEAQQQPLLPPSPTPVAYALLSLLIHYLLLSCSSGTITFHHFSLACRSLFITISKGILSTICHSFGSPAARWLFIIKHPAIIITRTNQVQANSVPLQPSLSSLTSTLPQPTAEGRWGKHSLLKVLPADEAAFYFSFSKMGMQTPKSLATSPCTV